MVWPLLLIGGAALLSAGGWLGSYLTPDTQVIAQPGSTVNNSYPDPGSGQGIKWEWVALAAAAAYILASRRGR